MRTAGFVLTGGMSSRMGRDKALLPVGNKRLVEEVAATLAQAVEKVFLVGKPERYTDLHFECLPDLRPDLGPLSGLEAALSAGKAELNVIAACDLGDLQARWVPQLLNSIQPGVICAAGVDKNGKRQPLCAVYTNDCLPVVRKAMDDGRLRAMDLLDDLNAVAVPLDGVICNLNTPAQFEEWTRRRALVE